MNTLEKICKTLSEKAKNQAFRPFDEELCEIIDEQARQIDRLIDAIHEIKNKGYSA